MPNMAIEGGKTAGWPIPPTVKEAFTDFCKEVGTLAKDDCAGALFVWQYLPAQIREWAKLDAKGTPAVQKEFWMVLEVGFGRAIERDVSAWLTEMCREPRSEAFLWNIKTVVQDLRSSIGRMDPKDFQGLTVEDQAIVEFVRNRAVKSPEDVPAPASRDRTAPKAVAGSPRSRRRALGNTMGGKSQEPA